MHLGERPPSLHVRAHCTTALIGGQRRTTSEKVAGRAERAAGSGAGGGRTVQRRSFERERYLEIKNNFGENG